MTAQEAIKRFKPIIDNEAYTDSYQDACKMAIEALEKQIPKVATNIETHYIPESYETDYVTGNCPSCGASFADGDFDDFYCNKCGQLVSWDDE